VSRSEGFSGLSQQEGKNVNPDPFTLPARGVNPLTTVYCGLARHVFAMLESDEFTLLSLSNLGETIALWYPIALRRLNGGFQGLLIAFHSHFSRSDSCQYCKRREGYIYRSNPTDYVSRIHYRYSSHNLPTYCHR
jgi:hypothetical protein